MIARQSRQPARHILVVGLTVAVLVVALLSLSFLLATLFLGKHGGVRVETRAKRLEYVDVGAVNIQFPQTYFHESIVHLLDRTNFRASDVLRP